MIAVGRIGVVWGKVTGEIRKNYDFLIACVLQNVIVAFCANTGK
jgi:hypothetical protein